MKFLLSKLILLSSLFISFIATAQFSEPKINPNDPSLPPWVRLMYAENPNVYKVDDAFKTYMREHPDESSVYIGYYNRWRRAVAPFIDEGGYVAYPSAAQVLSEQQRRNALRENTTSRNDIWSFAGPVVHYTPRYSSSDPSMAFSEQANTYSIDQSQSNPQILFAGTEAGGVYKSTDKGLNWNYVTPNILAYDVRSIRIDPTNPDIVLFGSSGKIWKTTDGGITWNPSGDASFQAINIYTWDLLFHPTSPEIIFAATIQGLYRTTDGGNNWTQILPNECHSLIFKADDPSVVYTMEYDPVSEISYFYKSTDTGLTFSIKQQGWFEVPAADQGKIQSYGGRLAVTTANPEKIYALLVGSSQSNANLQLNGFIGIYVSNDGGETWAFPQGYMGAPYDPEVNPNPMTFSGDNNPYNQIYYNTTIAVSQLDENKILFGGLSLWSSTDGAATYFPVAGYVGYIPYQHVDMQEIRSFKTGVNSEEIWIASDGGVNYSTDFYASHESRMSGIEAGEFWGFDQGWNEDIMVGGRYHNGNGGFYKDYPQGAFIALGGGEAPTGYVNYSDERKTYFSDIGGRILPEQIDGEIKTFNAGTYPNENYWINASSRVIFDPRYWNVCYMGKDNKIMKSTDGGASFSELYAFGNITSYNVYWFEQCFTNPDVMYVQQVQGSLSKMWKTSDGGSTWNAVTIPQTNKRNLFFTMSYTNENELWLAYTDGANGAKVYHTTDGGTNWTNLTTSILDNLHIWAITYQAGTNGGVYIATVEGDVFYRNNSMTDWTSYSTGLPVTAQPLRLVPFYKGQKIRLATWDIAIWEAPFYESSSLIGDFAADYASFYCPGDTVHFVDHSVSTANAAYQWSFPGGAPSSSTLRSPKVVYQNEGTFDVSLIITDGSVNDTIVKTAIIHSTPNGTLPLAEGFENGFDPLWNPHPISNGGSSWGINNTVGGYGNSTHCMFFDNYFNDLQGGHADVWTSKLDFSSLSHAMLKFDVAYAQYDNNYSDTLAVFVSNDCGATFNMVYYHGGDDLSTAPDYTPDIFVPTASQWRTDSVNLDAFLAEPELLISFQNRGYWGQAMYVDNVNINSGTIIGVPDITAGNSLAVFPNPNNGAFFISFYSSAKDNYSIHLVNALGENVFSEILHNFSGTFTKQMNEEMLNKGIYLLELEGKEGVVTRKVVIN